ncbi:MAG: ABC transporter substrate-binding protein [Pseudomonadota bacterium]|nr:ABC transporter substrate-binding protein [Pseudomonadota bacterium]
MLVNTVEQERALFGDDPFGFADLGYIEGKTVAFERRFANGNLDRLAGLAQELVNLKVDVIVTGGPGVYAAHRATATIPIVVGTIGDPVGQGFAVSLSHPGGNITGSAIFAPEVMAKRLELLKQIIPSLKRVGVLLVHSYAANPQYIAILAPTARALNLELSPIEVAGPDSYNDVFSAKAMTSIDGMVITETAQLMANAALIASLAMTRGLPAVGAPAQAAAGALLGYGVSQKALFHNAAAFADKILKGAKPGDIPFEQATKFETVVNLKTARAIGVDIPATVLAAADEVIE